MQIRKLLVSDFLRKIKPGFPSVKPKCRISKAIGLMQAKKIWALAICNKDIEVVTRYWLLRRSLPLHSRVSKVSFPPPTVSIRQKFLRLAELLLGSGATLVQKKALVARNHLISLAARSRELAKRKIQDSMSIPIVVKESADLGKVRSLMREHRIKCFPVVDEEGKLIGIVTSQHLLKAAKPKEREGAWDESGEIIPSYDLPSLMDPKPLTIEKKKSLKEASKLMERKDERCLVVEEDGGPIGIITPKDLLEEIVALREPRKVYVQWAGLPAIDEFSKRKLDDFVKATLQTLDGSLKLNYLFLHLKVYESNGKKKYSIRSRLSTSLGIFRSHSWGWKLLDAAHDALAKLEQQALRDQAKRRANGK